MASVVKFFIEGVATSLLGIFGIIGNLVSIVVLSSSELDMMPSFKHLLKMLAAFDATFLVFTLTLFGISPWSEHYEQYVKPYLIPYFLPIIQISLTGSVWTTMAVSVERYLTVCLSYRGPTMLGGDCHRHLFYSLPIVGMSVIFNIPRFFELRTEMNPMNQTIFNETLGENVTEEIFMPMVMPTEVRDNLKYSRDYVLIANSVALVFIPILTLIVLNSFIFRTISQATQRHNAISSNQRRDHSVAMMLIFIVAVFVVCHSIRSIINTYECIQFVMHGKLQNWPDWIQTLVHVNHFALVVNSSINILIYCCKDEKFLNVMLVTLGLSRFIRTPPPTNANPNNGGTQRRNDTRRNGTIQIHEPPSSQNVSARAAGQGSNLELQQCVVTTNANQGNEARVTTKLLPMASDPPSSSSLKTHGKSVVTVVEIYGEGCKIIKDDKASPTTLENSFNCEECCRSCSCGETMSSLDDSTVEEGCAEQPLMAAKTMAMVTKNTISTQTSLNGQE